MVKKERTYKGKLLTTNLNTLNCHKMPLRYWLWCIEADVLLSC